MGEAKRRKSDGTLSGRNPMLLAQAMSDAIMRGQRSGMALDETLCVAAQVIADYAHGAYGSDYVEALAGVMRERCLQPQRVNAMETHHG